MDRPILFSAPMVRAILAGTKTQTRRVFKGSLHDLSMWIANTTNNPNVKVRCPYGQPGDRLWVRETWMDLQGTGIQRRTGDPSRYAYGADTLPGSYGDEVRKEYGLKWRPSIHMPRAASRITLEITGVRVERLQDISEADAIAEGIEQMPCEVPDTKLWRNYTPDNGWTPRVAIPQNSYRSLWESINGPGSWDANPYVWVVEFRRAEGGGA